MVERFYCHKETIECGNPPYDDVLVTGLLDTFMDNILKQKDAAMR